MSDKTEEFFDQLYQDNQAKVYRLALGLTGNAQDAEDVTQEAFLRAFRSYHTFREESSFFTWIYRITLNVANDHMKQRTKLPIYTLTEDLGYSIEEIIDPNPSNDPETELLSYQARVTCMHALTECLPPDQRKVFCLAVNLNLPHKLIAEIMDCSIPSVKTTLHRARKRWFGYMEDKCQLINKSNPCNCKQFVRFGLSRGWISKEAAPVPPPPTALQIKSDLITLRSLRDLYRDLYPSTVDESLAERIRQGIRNGEWQILS